MQAVGHEVFHRMQPAEGAAVFVAKADIPPDVAYYASRFLATNDPVLVSVLHGEIGLAPDTDGAKAGESGFRQSKAATSDEFQLLRSRGVSSL